MTSITDYDEKTMHLSSTKIRIMNPHYYNVTVRWTRERRGLVWSPEITNPFMEKGCLEVATPPEFPNGVPGVWSPEHLFTASVTSCILTTFLAIAENSKLEFSSFICESRGKLERIDGKFLMTEIELKPLVDIHGDADRDKTLRILEKTEAACLISNSIKAKVTMTPTVRVAERNAQQI